MAKQGAHISDVDLLVKLDQRIGASGQAMANIDQSVISHLNNVRDTLERQLDVIREKLQDAEQRLSEAESACQACHASQFCDEFGMVVPSCASEENAVEVARMEVEKWRSKYEQGQQILGECQREVSDYNAGGHALVENMCEQQTKAQKILQIHISNLQDILKTDVGGGSSGGTIGTGAAVGAVGTAIASKFGVFNMGNSPMGVMISSLEGSNRIAFERNNKILEKVWGIKKEDPMTIAEADRQSANPNFEPEFIEDPNGDWFRLSSGGDDDEKVGLGDQNGNSYRSYGRLYNRKWDVPIEMQEQLQQKSLIRYRMNPDYKYEYSVNCATTSAAYEMRRQGWPVHAKGNLGEEGNLNYEISKDPFAIWNNADGSKAEPITYGDWMRKNGLYKMTSDDYKHFFEEECKEPGRYIFTTAWKGSGAHASILERDQDGKLYFIEPQVFDKYMADGDGRRNIEDFTDKMFPYQRWSHLGVMRVDDKLFNPKYASIFEIDSNGK